MSLWTPRDASRPLWTPGRRPPSYTGRRLLPYPFAVAHHENPEGRERGLHQRDVHVPRRGTSPSEVRSGRPGLGLPPGRGEGGRRVSLRPRQRVESGDSAGANSDVKWWRQPAGQEPTPLAAPAMTPGVVRLWMPLQVSRVDPGDTPTTPLDSHDTRHVALSRLFAMPDIADLPADGGDERVEFPYLQLHPPHCGSCACRCLGACRGASQFPTGCGQRYDECHGGGYAGPLGTDSGDHRG